MSQIPAPDLNSALSRTGQLNGFSSMSSEDFIRIIFTELANQDPFQPNDSPALLEQMSSIRGIESDIELMDRLQGMVFENQLSPGASLIGKSIEGLSTFSELVAGRAASVQRSGESVMLQLDNGAQVPMSNLVSIHEGTAPSP